MGGGEESGGIQATEYSVDDFRGTKIISLILIDLEGKPQSLVDFKLTLEEQTIEGTTDGNGKLEQKIPSKIKNGILEIEGYFIELKFDNFEPLEDTKGLQKRLMNLGYNPGEINGIMSPKTKDAIKQFQKAYPPLIVDGCFNGDTKNKLTEIYGS